MLKAFCRLIPQNFNDSLALFLLVGIPTLWVVMARAGLDYPRDATISGFTIVIMYYFRKAAPERKDPCPTCNGTGIKP